MNSELNALLGRIHTLEGELEQYRPADRGPRIALAMIERESIHRDVFDQWQELLWRHRWPGPRFTQRAIYPVWGRNDITSHALSRDDWEWLYWTDDDQMPDLGLVTRLRELVQMPEMTDETGGVVCGAYYGRALPHEVQLYEPHPEHVGMRPIQPSVWLVAIENARRCGLALQPAPLMPIGGGGTGSMLIKRSLLERMQSEKGRGKVWETPPIDPSLLETMRAEGNDWPGGIWTEDIWFCVEVKQRYGVQVYADTDFRLSSAHLATERISVNHYVAGHTLPEGFHLEKQAQVSLPAGYKIQPPLANRAQRRAAARR